MTTQELIAELKSVTYDLMSLLERETTGLRTITRDEYEQFFRRIFRRPPDAI